MRGAHLVVAAFGAKERLLAHPEFGAAFRGEVERSYAQLARAVTKGDAGAAQHIASFTADLRRIEALHHAARRRGRANAFIAARQNLADMSAQRLTHLGRARLQHHRRAAVRHSIIARPATLLPPPASRSALVSTVLTAAPPSPLPSLVHLGAAAA